ncbi:MAG: pyridoxamine 5'-phosphate oxidase family protein [Pseudomonadales bacterium]
MNPQTMRIASIILTLAGVASTSLASDQPEADRTNLLELARGTMAAARYCALITVDEKGQPRARTVEPFAPDKNFSIWIATRPNTRKVAQIAENPKVTLYYFDAQQRNYVTVMGTARLVVDEDTKIAMRRPVDSDRLYPDFPDDYLLIEVTPTWLEAIVPGYRGDAETWRPASVHF